MPQRRTKRLGVALHIPAFLNYECLACGGCCREYEITLTDDEHRRLSAVNWSARDREMDVANPFSPSARRRRGGPRYCFTLRPDGRCAFLASDAKCIIHKHLGYEAKALTCRLFPLTLVRTPLGWYAGARYHCAAVAVGMGPPLEQSRVALENLCLALEEGGREVRFGERVDFDGVQSLSWPEYAKIERALLNLLLRPDAPLWARLAGAWRFVDLLRSARLANVGAARFEEFARVLAEGALNEVSDEGPPEGPPAPAARWMFYQRLFLLHRRRGAQVQRLGFGARLRTRWQGGRAAARFGTVSGRVDLFGSGRPLALREVGGVRFRTLDAAGQAAIERFVAGKVFGKQIFGPSLFGYPFVRGFTVLLLACGAAAWFARAWALSEGRDETETRDLLRAIQHVDFSFGFSRALAGKGERLRLAVLGRGDLPARIALWQLAQR